MEMGNTICISVILTVTVAWLVVTGHWIYVYCKAKPGKAKPRKSNCV